MIFRLLSKFKKSISLLIVLCITIPLIGACGEAENNVDKSRSNKIIGVGGSIEAYTTYSQAKFIQMDKQMYHSYLLSYRDFILVVVPKDENGNPNSNSLMYQAAYNGVTPYSEQLTADNKNFTFKTPQYKLLIYYVMADDFLEWENKSNEDYDANFITKALDFMGPSDADNYEKNSGINNEQISKFKENNKEANVIQSDEKYNLKNVVNRSVGVSECDFLRVTKNSSNNKYEIASYKDVSNTTALTKCGANGYFPKGKNVIADVANGYSDGVTLLFGAGALTGYFTSDQVTKYDFINAPWLEKLLNSYTGNTTTQKMMDFISSKMREEGLCGKTINGQTIDCNDQSYSLNAIYKFQYDLALLGRIKKINYNTLLNINATSTVINSLNTIDDINEYEKILHGDMDKNNGTYIAFTTADGFIIDRGNILMSSAADLLFNMDFLETLSQMDACTNRTLASYLAEVLSTVGIVAGGIAVGVGAVATIATVAAIGAGSLSVPVVGWLIGGILLVAAGALLLAESIATKKAIDDTNSANFCDVYKDVIKEIIEMSSVKIPIYHYNIEEDDNHSVELCYADYVEVKDASGKKVQKCGSYNKNNEFVSFPTIPTFKLANVSDVNKLSSLSGAPSIRLYSEGKLVDEIYGASSIQYIYSVLDSWGLTSSANMRYYTKKDGSSDNIIINSLLDSVPTITDSSYCFSLEYGKSCDGGITSPKISFNSNGVATLTPSNTKYNEFINSLKRDLQNPGGKSERKSHLEIKTGVSDYQKRLKKIAKYMDTSVYEVIDEEGKLTDQYVMLDGKKFFIKNHLTSLSLETSSKDKINCTYELDLDGIISYKCHFDDLDFKVLATRGSDNLLRYSMSLDGLESEVNYILAEVNNLINSKGTNKLNEFKEAYLEAFSSKNTSAMSDLIDELVSDKYIGNVVYYSQNYSIYFTADIVDKQWNEEEKKDVYNTTYSSTLYKEEIIELRLKDDIIRG